MVKKRVKEKKVDKLSGFSIQFLPFSDVRHLDSNERIKKILNIVVENNILILQGKLKSDEEARLIGDTMVLIDHVKGFRGIEIAVIEGDGNEGIFSRIRGNIATLLSGGNLNAITIIGPATIVKEIKKNPKKIELLLNK